MRIFFIICLLAVDPSYAQLCQGSLGDPIVNINFGSGANPGSQLSAATTAYTYAATDCPPDGSYSVRNSTAGCFDETWHDVAGDHTQNGNGYFMLVNASYQPNDFYLDTVTGLCANTTYELAAWIMNITEWGCNNNPIKPDLTFRIETLTGTVLKVYNTGEMSVTVNPEWKQYGTFFATPSMVNSVALRIRNNAPGGCGNDLALDDITFRPCGPLVTPQIVGEPTVSVSYCEGTPRSYTLTSNISGGFTDPVYQWQYFDSGNWINIPGATALNYVLDLPATRSPVDYLYRLLVAENGNLNISQCRIASLPITITIKPMPLTSLNNTSPVCENNTVTITAGGGSGYSWTGPNGFTSTDNPVVLTNSSNDQSGNYSVIITNAEGCSKTETTLVEIDRKPVAVMSFIDTIICIGENVKLFVQPGTDLQYQWEPVSSIDLPQTHDPVATPSNDTRYTVYVISDRGCMDTGYINVTVKQLPVVNAGPDKYKLANQPVTLNASVIGDYDFFEWTPQLHISNSHTLSPAVNPPEDLTYFLKATSSCGESIDSVNVKYYSGVFIPNAFTPNNDGVNDTWVIPALFSDPAFKLSIFNRYGQLVYHNHGNYIPWNGKYSGMPLPMSSYVYQLNFQGKIYKGTVTLIR